jgi:hypothetical protein
VSDHGIAQYACTEFPEATTAFHPLFLYESVSGVLGAVALLWIARRYGRHMRPGDLLLIFFAWYAVVRLALETLRTGNWTFFGVPTAIVVSALVIVGSLAALALRHRPGAGGGDRWGDPPEPDDDDEEWVEDDDADDEPAGADDLEGDGDEPDQGDTEGEGDVAADDGTLDDADDADDGGDGAGTGDGGRADADGRPPTGG